MANNYWIHRIAHEWEVSYSLLDMGYVSYGWHCYMKYGLEGADSFDEEILNSFFAAQNENSRSRHCLKRFLSIIPGDRIVIPMFDKKFCVCEVLERARPISAFNGLPILTQNKKDVFVTEEGIQHADDQGYYDIGFLIKVRKLQEIPRSYAPVALQSRMKIRQANAEINDLQAEVEEVLKTNGPVDIKEKLIESASPAFSDVLRNHVNPDNMEKIVKWYMERIGANLVFIPPKNESGKKDGADADVVAEFYDLRLVIYIQVKKHEGETNEWAATQIQRYKEQKQDEDSEYTYISWVISTAEDFSDAAVLDAQINNIRLIGGHEFVRMLLSTGISDINEAIQ